MSSLPLPDLKELSTSLMSFSRHASEFTSQAGRQRCERQFNHQSLADLFVVAGYALQRGDVGRSWFTLHYAEHVVRHPQHYFETNPVDAQPYLAAIESAKATLMRPFDTQQKLLIRDITALQMDFCVKAMGDLHEMTDGNFHNLNAYGEMALDSLIKPVYKGQESDIIKAAHYLRHLHDQLERLVPDVAAEAENATDAPTPSVRYNIGSKTMETADEEQLRRLHAGMALTDYLNRKMNKKTVVTDLKETFEDVIKRIGSPDKPEPGSLLFGMQEDKGRVR